MKTVDDADPPGPDGSARAVDALAIMSDKTIAAEEKIDALLQMRTDLLQQSVATEENMPCGRADVGDRLALVMQALAALGVDADCVSRPVPSKS